MVASYGAALDSVKPPGRWTQDGGNPPRGADTTLIESIAKIDQRLVALLSIAGIFGELSKAAAQAQDAG